MTKVIEGAIVLTYEEWEKRPAVKELFGEIEECDTCYGSGDHECDCGDTHECGACGGSGKVKDIRNIYEEELRSEIKRLIAWREGLAIKNPSLMGDEKHKEFASAVKIRIHGNAN